jgi:hypothetical protein
MGPSEKGVSSAALGVVRELDRLNRCEREAASQRKLLRRARAALTRKSSARPRLRERVARSEIIAHLAEQPGSSIQHMR